MARNNAAIDDYVVEAECVKNICAISDEFLRNVERWGRVLNSVEKAIDLFDKIMKEKIANGASANEALDSTLMEIRLDADLRSKE